MELVLTGRATVLVCPECRPGITATSDLQVKMHRRSRGGLAS
jgi:hypothetical protein